MKLFKLNGKFILALVLSALVISCAGDKNQNPATDQNPPRTKTEDNHNSEQAKQAPYVVFISIDGFRSDYIEKFNPKNIQKLANEGVRSVGLIPSFPSLTFPNHVTLVTGKYPGRHGIVSNFFYDKKRNSAYQMNDGAAVNDGTWYRGEPLWAVAERSGMLSATCFWVGSEAKIGGIDPTYVRDYSDAAQMNNESRINQVIDWLKLPEDKRPHMISLYFSDVDSAGHKYGPDSEEVSAALKDIDSAIGKLVGFIDGSQLPVQLVLVSDHGMQKVSQQINLLKFTDLKDVKSMERGALTLLYSNDSSKIEKIYSDLKSNEKNFKVYKPEQLPKEWRFDDMDRIGDLIVVADPGFYLIKDENFGTGPARVSAATHGWSPANKQMYGLFIARGSMIKNGLKIDAFENVHVYPFVLKLLSLKTEHLYDGNEAVLKNILK